MNVIRLGILAGFIAFSSSTLAQELTPEQVAEDIQRQIAATNVPVRVLTPEQLAWLQERLENAVPPGVPGGGSQMLMSKTQLYNSRSNTGTKMLVDSEIEMPLMASTTVQSGTSYVQELIDSLGITENQMYGKPQFDSGYGWNTDNTVPLSTYPWVAVRPRQLLPTNGSMAVYRNYTTGSGKLWTTMPRAPIVYTNQFTGMKVTNVSAYILRFKYTWDQQNTNTYFRCTPNPNAGPFINLAPAATWTQVTAVINDTSPSYMYWVHGCGTSSVKYNTVRLDAVQFIPIPGPSSKDLSIVANSDNTVTVQWNLLTYLPDRFVLEYANNVNGPWATNVPAPVVTDYVASLTFTNAGIRFYRMHHK